MGIGATGTAGGARRGSSAAGAGLAGADSDATPWTAGDRPLGATALGVGGPPHAVTSQVPPTSAAAATVIEPRRMERRIAAGAQAQPLTPPIVRPAMNQRCRMK